MQLAYYLLGKDIRELLLWFHPVDAGFACVGCQERVKGVDLARIRGNHLAVVVGEAEASTVVNELEVVAPSHVLLENSLDALPLMLKELDVAAVHILVNRLAGVRGRIVRVSEPNGVVA